VPLAAAVWKDGVLREWRRDSGLLLDQQPAAQP
jgi:imidazolonepropionase